MQFSSEDLLLFIKAAAQATYAGGGKREEHPERDGFIELVYSEGDFTYRDSYTGFYRSWGTETVRFENKPVWISSYGGGMEKGQEEKALDTFNFLKKALSNTKQDSFRGPDAYTDNEWKYKYQQEGDISKFHGYEEIFYKGELVFTHRIIGGLVKAR